ncbi:EAL domain-containing protein [Limimaricola sp. G21655-S1]|uniref:EAL domain-containing protein n=1 Tax=Limimaricola sp. G21655-S1 TaxID=3014768 RepID=UPI0022AF7045|nr:EAL domain-containing protein [Limimaricola sp. G21655-S1]MCZ4259514.1 EAL domain-containing protein [Limimaricola sp. G21655-S1]
MQSEADPPADPFAHAMALDAADIPQLVRAALADRRTELAYQPVIVAKTGATVFHEGLIRLRDQAGRLLPARHFLPGVEETDLGRDLDRAALREGLEALRRDTHLRLSINMSARSIGDGRWRRTLQDGLDRGPDLGERLILEISEGSAMILPELVGRFMSEIRPRGVSFVLDEFGAGRTAFRHLRGFLFDIAKIDPHFVRGIGGDPDNQVLCGALVAVARQLGMASIACGVETEAEARMLGRIGVDCMQGYLWGRPARQPRPAVRMPLP